MEQEIKGLARELERTQIINREVAKANKEVAEIIKRMQE